MNYRDRLIASGRLVTAENRVLTDRSWRLDVKLHAVLVAHRKSQPTLLLDRAGRFAAVQDEAAYWADPRAFWDKNFHQEPPEEWS